MGEPELQDLGDGRPAQFFLGPGELEQLWGVLSGGGQVQVPGNLGLWGRV